MICEYPEEFIIPVIYADDLKKQSNYRQKDFESLGDWNLLIFDEELQGDKTLQGNMNIEAPGEIGDKNFLDMDVDLLPKLYKKSMLNHNLVEESLEDENIKNILNDIDNEYVNSETLCVCSKH